MQLLDGKKVSEKLLAKLTDELKALKSNVRPSLAIILCTNDFASQKYVNFKISACEKVGIHSILVKLNQPSEDELKTKIQELNNNPDIHGILVQFPLENISKKKVMEWISPEKDVDGITPGNVGLVTQQFGDPIISCTPFGIMYLLKEYNIPIQGKNVVIIGRSKIVGKPLSTLFLNEGATVTVTHRYTQNLKNHTLNADILVSATGIPFLVKEDMVREGAVVVDVGINNYEGKLVGDVDFERVSNKVSYITPVPGGIGPMTIASLINNCIKCFKKQK